MPGNAVVHYHLGLAYLKKGEKDLGRQELERTLSLDENFDKIEELRKVLKEL